MVLLCRLQISADCPASSKDRTSMLIHAQSHAQALLAAQELFPSCQVKVICIQGGNGAQAGEPCET
jgi:hypothetical protein